MKRLALCALLVASGCAGEPRLDTSSMEAMGKSIKAMEARLPKDEQPKLVGAIAMKTMGSAMRQAMAGNKSPDLTSDLKDWHGLTAKEIIAKAPAPVAKPAIILPDWAKK